MTNTNGKAWPPALRDGIALLADAYARLFRREARARLRAEFTELDLAEFERVVDEAARRSWTSFEQDELPSLIADLAVGAVPRPSSPHREPEH